MQAFPARGFAPHDLTTGCLPRVIDNGTLPHQPNLLLFSSEMRSLELSDQLLSSLLFLFFADFRKQFVI